MKTRTVTQSFAERDIQEAERNPAEVAEEIVGTLENTIRCVAEVQFSSERPTMKTLDIVVLTPDNVDDNIVGSVIEDVRVRWHKEVYGR